MPWVELPENLVDIIDLGVPFLIHHHAIEKFHVSAPAGDGLHPVFCVAYLFEIFETLVSLGLRGFLGWHERILRERGVHN